MGELEGVRNAWGYVEGGNGAASAAIARAAESHGAVLYTNAVCAEITLSRRNGTNLLQPVTRILTSGEGRACGVLLEDDTEIRAKAVLSNATPKVTYFDLISKVSCVARWLPGVLKVIDWSTSVTTPVWSVIAPLVFSASLVRWRIQLVIIQKENQNRMAKAKCS
jgi:phytoene dehydrogenase-like protein